MYLMDDVMSIISISCETAFVGVEGVEPGAQTLSEITGLAEAFER
jgi:hypothetical protein